MSGLTREDAERRAAAVRVHRYAVTLDVTAPGETFRSTTTISFRAMQPETFVEVVCEELLSATLDGKPLDDSAFARSRIALTGLGGEHELVVDVRMRYSHDGEGLHRFVDPADDAVYLCATSSIDNAKRWFACFDQPDLKAAVALEVHCPPEWTVVGNGAATRLAAGHWLLADTPPISTYLVTVVAGPWHSVHGEHDGIPLGLHVRRSLAAELDRDAATLLDLTAKSFDAFHELFGVRYPFGEYHQAFVPEFNWGAVEQPGCVTYRDQMIFRSTPSDSQFIDRTTTVVHEMAHMWFGDLVTMRWWDDMWLNESFAEYLSHRVTAEITDLPVWEDFGAGRKGWGYSADRRATTHPIAANGANDAHEALEDFDGISYAKGASVLRQLAAYIGDDMFVGGLRDYIRRYEYGNATFADLMAAWGAHARPGTPSPADLARWADEWLRTAGVDVISVRRNGRTAELRRGDPQFGVPAQRPHAMTVKVLPRGPAVGVRLDAAELVVPLEAPADAPLLPNAGDETWATIRLDPQDWQRLPAVIGELPHGPERVVIWNALRAAMADSVVSPELVVDTIVAGLPGEVPVVAGEVLLRITNSLALFVPNGPRRDALRNRLAAAARALLDTAPVGAEAQSTAARAWLALTDDLPALERWSAGESDVEGLLVDAELRWSVLERRAALGALNQDEIDAAFAADRSASGSLHARHCEAARPDPDAKERAWRALVDPSSDLSHYQLKAFAEGFWVPGQEQLVAPFAPRWFAEMPATATFRGGYALRDLARVSFPMLVVDEANRDRARELAVRDDVDSAIRRVASDGSVELTRGLAARARFA
jgi:aminopeptidase N